MVVDDIWPDDFEGARVGRPRYEDIANYVKQKGGKISTYAVGRHARRLRAFTRMKEGGGSCEK